MALLRQLHQLRFVWEMRFCYIPATGGASYQFRIDGAVVQAWSATNTFTHTFTADGVVTVDVATLANGAGCTKTYNPAYL